MYEIGQHNSTLGHADEKQLEYEDVKNLSSDDQIVSSFYDDDGVHDGLQFPTEEERRTLRRVSDSIPWAAYSECFRILMAPGY
jgi:POT family proton-dependent oligopeptide transporter